jgi:Abortive infection C-terminus
MRTIIPSPVLAVCAEISARRETHAELNNLFTYAGSQAEDQDLQTILTGMISIVDGIGSLRTHASSAHGAGRKPYKLEPRRARLAIHSSHTVVLFVLESWQKKQAIKHQAII